MKIRLESYHHICTGHLSVIRNFYVPRDLRGGRAPHHPKILEQPPTKGIPL